MLGCNTPQKNLIGVYLNNEIQSVTPNIPSDLSQNHSDTTSTASSFQSRKKIINLCSRQKINLAREKEQQRNNAATTKNNLKNLDENEACQRIIEQIFKHKVDSTYVLRMHRELNNIQGLNKESYQFKDESRKNGRIERSK